MGSVFGAPLAVEALLAFFLESTFLGVWIFGKGRVSARVHLASIWLVSIGTMLSALFILAANAWMQHPVGYKVVGNRAVMTNFWAVMTNSTLIGSFLHVLFSALVTSTMLVSGVSGWHLLKDRRAGRRAPAGLRHLGPAGPGRRVRSPSWPRCSSATTRHGSWRSQQPMKMAAAEAIYNTQNGASFSLLTIGDLSGNPVFQIRLPHMLSVLADNNWDGSVQGINQIQATEAAKYGPGNYKPILWVTYWTFRIMVGCGILMLVMMAVGLWLMRRRRLEQTAWFLRIVGLRHCSAVRREYDRLDIHGDGATTVGRVRAAQDLAGRSHVGTGYVVTTLVGFTPSTACWPPSTSGSWRNSPAARADEPMSTKKTKPKSPTADRVPALIY